MVANRRSSRRRSQRGALSATVWALTVAATFGFVAGCAEGWEADPARPLFTNPFDAGGVYWTILCMEVQGAGNARVAEQVAETLRNTRGFDPNGVFVTHETSRSRVYYGKYYRRPVPGTGKFDLPAEMQRDAALVKDLTVDGGRFFLESRPVPYPTPDVGNPNWQLKNNPATYALRIALFYDEPGFLERKKAAAAYCAELREKGYDAYYRHSDFVSEVFVGEFGPDALVDSRKMGVAVKVNGPEVRSLQFQERGRFRYELWNMKLRSIAGPTTYDYDPESDDPETDGRGRLVVLSRLFPVREFNEDDYFDF